MNYENLETEVEQLEALIESGDYSLTEIRAREHLILFPTPYENNEIELYCRVLLALSESLWRRGLSLEATSSAEQALALAEQGENKKLIAKASRICGIVCKERSDYLGALEYFKKSLILNKELGNQRELAFIFCSYGIVYNALSDYPQSLEYYQKSLTVYEELDDKSGMAAILSNLGTMYCNISDFNKALEYYQKSLAIFEKYGGKARVATILNNCGNIYFNLSNYNKSIEYLQKCIAIFEELGNELGMGSSHCNIGNAYRKLSDYEQALLHFQKALAIYEKIGRKEGIAVNLGNIGLVYDNLWDNTKALTYYYKSLAIYEELGRKDGIARNLGNIGTIYKKQKFEGYDLLKAEELLLKSIAIYMEIEDKVNLYKSHNNLANLYRNEKRWEDFAVHFEKYHDLEKEVQNEDAMNQSRFFDYRRKIEESERDRQVKLARFQEQEKILHNILPSQIADRMIEGEKTIADSHEHVSVFFSDIVGFTKLSQQVSAEELVGMLNGIFSQFDQIARKHGLEKIKTIGDAYMAVCGAPIHVDNHAERTALFALEVSELMSNYSTGSGDKVSIRIGLHSGSVVAGIIGENKFSYDMWGDVVNTASRMESHGEAGKIHVSEEFLKRLLMVNGEWLMEEAGDVASLTINHSPLTINHSPLTINNSPLTIIPRGEMAIKGKGMMKTYFLERTAIPS